MNEDNSEEVVEDNVSDDTPETTDFEPSDPVEEPQIETTPILGKFKSQSDLEKAYVDLERDYHTKNAQLKEYEKPKYSSEEQRILDELTALGVATKADLSQWEASQTIKAADDAQIKALKLTEKQESSLRKFASHKDNIYKSMIDCWNELSDSMGTSGTVVSRKTTIKPRSGNKNTVSQDLSQSEIARLPEAEYNKYWADYAANKANS